MTAAQRDPRSPEANGIVPRNRDGSLGPQERQQQRISPNSLVWKYYGDTRKLLLIGRFGTTENMYPQLGQAVSDHSIIFSNLFERVRRSGPPIARIIYGENPETTALQVRNYHKPLQGVVEAPSSKYHGTEYKALDPETFYWAHATFLDSTYTAIERFIKPLTLDEKEQLFQESRQWYSLYGVESVSQPETYLEFKEYWDRTVRDDLIGDTKVAQYTVGYIKKGLTRAFPEPKKIPKPVWNFILKPTIDNVAAFLGAGGLDAAMRDKLAIPWSRRQDVQYRAFCRVIRAVGPLWERFAPINWRYSPEAVEGFRREGIDPRSIELGRGSKKS
jgi:uncharacterized protein (DUF2236 family)